MKTHLAIVAYVGECCSAPHVALRCITKKQADSKDYLFNLKARLKHRNGYDVGDCFIIEATTTKDIT